MKVRVFVEGGGSKALNPTCRRSFRKFLEEAGLDGRKFEIVPCGRRTDALEDFKAGLADRDCVAFLLVDAERPVKAPATRAKPWQHLKEAPDNWNRPRVATDHQCHLMVQVMESWLLADPEALKSYYGKDFRIDVLPKNQRIEQVSKRDIENRLEQATRDTKKGGYYKNKGKHSFEILAELNPVKVRCKSPYAARFLNELERISGQ